MISHCEKMQSKVYKIIVLLPSNHSRKYPEANYCYPPALHRPAQQQKAKKTLTNH